MTADLAIKQPCRAATTGNISLSGLSTIDGVALAAGDRVLVRAQSSAVDNGIWVAASGAWARATDFDAAGEAVGGTQVLVTSGTTGAGLVVRISGNGSVTIGTDPILFEAAFSAIATNFVAAGAGAATRTIRDKGRELPTPADYGAVGDNTADDTAAITALLVANRHVNMGGSDKIYKVTDTIAVPSNTTIVGQGATLRQTAVRTAIFDIGTGSGVRFEGIKLVGLGTDFNNSTSSEAVGIRGGWPDGNCSDITITGCHFTGFTLSSAHFFGVNGLIFSFNTVVGPGPGEVGDDTDGACYGVAPDQNSSNVIIVSNIISATAQGIATGNNCTNVTVSGNVVFDICGQHGMYFGSAQTNLTIASNVVRNCGLIGIKVQNYDATGDAFNISIMNNVVKDVGDHGIAVLTTPWTGTALTRLNSVTVTGNSVINAAQDGINFRNLTVGVVSSNTVTNAGREGISISACDQVIFAHNAVHGAAHCGVRDILACSNCTMDGNQFYGCGTAATGDRLGILIQWGSGWVFRKNIVRSAGANMAYGCYILSDATTVFEDNIIENTAAGGYGGRFLGTAIERFANNKFTGTVAPTLNAPAVNQRGNRNQEFFSNAVPSTGTWLLGDRVMNTAVTNAAGVPIGWVCVVAGTPGTWRPFGVTT